MFYYYGRKKKIAHLYPEPLEDSDYIIEPFAGSAAYSLCGNRWQKQIELYDTSSMVVKIWKYLLSATENDIKKLPNPEHREDIRKYFNLCQEEKWIIGLAINPGSTKPCNIVQKFSRWNSNKKYIIDNLYKIKHWKIYEQSYESANNIYATWFIDPPYYKEGRYYVENNIDYLQLSDWCLKRNGLQIVCEGENSNWLPFQELCQMTAIGKRKPKEYVFINIK